MAGVPVLRETRVRTRPKDHGADGRIGHRRRIFRGQPRRDRSKLRLRLRCGLGRHHRHFHSYPDRQGELQRIVNRLGQRERNRDGDQWEVSLRQLHRVGLGGHLVGDTPLAGLNGGIVTGMAISGTMMVTASGDGSIESFDISVGPPSGHGDLQNSTVVNPGFEGTAIPMRSRCLRRRQSRHARVTGLETVGPSA